MASTASGRRSDVCRSHSHIHRAQNIPNKFKRLPPRPRDSLALDIYLHFRFVPLKKAGYKSMFHAKLTKLYRTEPCSPIAMKIPRGATYGALLTKSVGLRRLEDAGRLQEHVELGSLSLFAAASCSCSGDFV